MSSGGASWVQSRTARLHATLHRPTGQAHDLCIVVVPAVGHEYTHSHSAVRVLCETLCDAGFFVTRFDLAGTGNSTAGDTDQPLLDTWVQNLADVVAWTQAQSGCRHLAVAGLRIGANVAALFAQRHSVHSLLLWAPCVRGASFLRDCQMIGTASNYKKETGNLDCGGIVLDALTQEQFGKLRLDQALVQTSRVCLLDRDDAGVAAAVQAWLATPENELKVIDLKVIEQRQYAQMMRQSMHSLIPTDSIREVATWFSDSASALGPRIVPNAAPAIPSDAKLEAETPHQETFCYFGSDPLFGILCRPTASNALRTESSGGRFGTDPRTDVVIIPNTGGAHHVGPCNLHVCLAQALADVGIASFRFDLGNLGDSVSGMPRGVDQPYPRRGWQDVLTVLEALTTQHGYSRFAFAGLCSGAFTGFQALNRYLAGVSPHQIALTVMINPSIYYWDEKLVKNDCMDSGQYEDVVSAYTEKLASGDKFRKLLSGEVDLVRAVTTTSKRLIKKVQSALHGLMDRAGLTKSQIAKDIETAHSRGCQIRIYASDTDPAIAILHNLGGHSVRRLMGNETLPVTVLTGADHTFSAVDSRDRLVQAIVGDIRS